jgi:hypothetical protein
MEDVNKIKIIILIEQIEQEQKMISIDQSLIRDECFQFL